MPRSDGTVVIDTKIDMSGLNKGTVDIGEQFGKIAASAKKLGATIASVFAIREIIQFGKESSTAAMEMSDALMGLQSIVEGQGRSFGAAKNFIDEYISDGLVPATNAITAYKNLAMRGYDDMQIQKVLIALKDAAAFGRQAGLSLGDAIQGATEGLKNENSVLVDNAGVTKNVAKMWESYAESIGTTADKLTQQQKIQAEITGILEETKYQTGDAARVTGTLSGQLMKLQFGFNNLKIAVGNAINPIIQTFIPVINTAISVLTRFANTVAAVIGALFGSSFAKITSTAENVSSGFSSAAENAENLADATSGAGKAAQKSLASFDELNKLSDPNSGGGGGGGGGGVSGAEIEMENLEGTIIEDSLSPQIQAIVNKIKELIAPLKEIDFTKAIKSIKEFGYAFVGLGKTIGKTLESAWKTILVPLTKWAIEKGGPASVDLLTSMVKALTKWLDPLVDGFEILMDAMDPIFEFIGDSFIVILDSLKGMMEKVGDVFEEKGDTIRQIFQNVGDVIGAVWTIVEPILEALRKSFETVFDFISTYVANKIEVVLGVLDGLTGFIAGVFTGDWDRAWAGVKTVFETITNSISTTIKAVTDFIGQHFNNAVSVVKAAWEGVSGWFRENVISPLSNAFSGLWDTITGIFTGEVQLSGLVDKVGGYFKTLANAIIKGFNNALIRANSYINQAIGKFKNFTIGGVKPFSGISYSVAPQIPYLAKGAVIPPHAPFMAMLGDQAHGTNIEAPLSTIQEALALELADQVGGMMAGFEAVIARQDRILEAILGIEIGDSVIGEAVERYNQITRKARGTA